MAAALPRGNSRLPECAVSYVSGGRMGFARIVPKNLSQPAAGSGCDTVTRRDHRVLAQKGRREPRQLF